ncbi:hypothetical protein [Xanthomonas phage SB3]|uniref:Uncharacterized protein n=1 Tax=Xanthomonas phage SB3 TaxID=3117472 RepID=A0ABZ2GZF6_9CAUD
MNTNKSKWDRKMSAATGKNFDTQLVREPHVHMPKLLTREQGAAIKRELRK